MAQPLSRKVAASMSVQPTGAPAQASAASPPASPSWRLAMLIIPSMDILSKLLSKEINGIQVAQWRFGFQALYILPLLLWLKGVCRPRAEAHRDSTCCAQCSWPVRSPASSRRLTWMSVPDAIAVFFVEPLILTILSGLILKEQVGWRRRIAVGVGFIGALDRHSAQLRVFGPVSLLPVCTAFLFANYLLLTKTLAAHEDPLTMQFFSGVAGFAVLSAISWAGGHGGHRRSSMVWPTPQQWMLLAGVGLIATICHLMIVHAFKRAPASVLAPFNYLEIVSATLLSYLVFQDVPDAWKWLGISIIVGSGLYVWWRERQLAG
jgi:S-adenosylmethionine uptake transporter